MTENPEAKKAENRPWRRGLVWLSAAVVVAFGGQQAISYLQAQEHKTDSQPEDPAVTATFDPAAAVVDKVADGFESADAPVAATADGFSNAPAAGFPSQRKPRRSMGQDPIVRGSDAFDSDPATPSVVSGFVAQDPIAGGGDAAVDSGSGYPGAVVSGFAAADMQNLPAGGGDAAVAAPGGGYPAAASDSGWSPSPGQPIAQARAEFDRDQRRFQLQIDLLKNRIAQLEARLQRRARMRNQLIQQRVGRPPRSDYAPGAALPEPGAPLQPGQPQPPQFDPAGSPGPGVLPPGGSPAGLPPGASQPANVPMPSDDFVPRGGNRARNVTPDQTYHEPIVPSDEFRADLSLNSDSTPVADPGAGGILNPPDDLATFDGLPEVASTSRPTEVSVTSMLVVRYNATHKQLEEVSGKQWRTSEDQATIQRLRRVVEILTEQIASQIKLKQLERVALQARINKLAQAEASLAEAGFEDPNSSRAIKRTVVKVKSELEACEKTLADLQKIVGVVDEAEAGFADFGATGEEVGGFESGTDAPQPRDDTGTGDSFDRADNGETELPLPIDDGDAGDEGTGSADTDDGFGLDPVDRPTKPKTTEQDTSDRAEGGDSGPDATDADRATEEGSSTSVGQ